MKNSYRKVHVARVLQGILIFLMVMAAVDNTAAQVKEWNYVVLGDSQSFGLFPRYTAILEQDLGVKINITNRAVGGQHSSSLVRELRENRDLQHALKEAKVVTLNVPMAVFGNAGFLFNSGNCGGVDNQDCFRDALKVYQEDTAAIFAEIVSLSNPSKALVRTMDTHQMMVRQRKARGGFEVVKFYWQAANKCVIEVATKHRIPMARVYAAFMGPNGDDDPEDKGLVSKDGQHPTAQGNDLIARLFRELGYQYAPP